ncbi:Response regulator receiver domain-containing protein [Cognatiyoonia koreensis]|uniref:Response regulator receiver domain-containing protein n=1 Tax=Cognatiyoonia koreensis TaxID=364200 RepID=A0A1I0NB89_9RHOB|nr:response regulator [Cognatiyoonia koreensis]SEV97803.1 Response regulator receiver domain-containing protein [Cognatiyoonia koreensis]
MKILIVEDDPTIAMDLEDELSDRGYDPVSAATVPDARKLLERQAPSFAFLDMHLRTDTSFDLARELREQGVPFAFVSGNDASALPEDLRTSKILTKPINYDDLIKMIAGAEKSS